MQIFYLAIMRLPTEKAHGIQIMKMCEAFAAQGHSVELVVPWRFNPLKADPFDYYNVSRSFAIKVLPALDLVRWGRFGFLIHSVTFSIVATFYLLGKTIDLLYSRDALPLWLAGFFRKHVAWEVHAPQWNIPARSLLKRGRFFVVITNSLKRWYEERGIQPERILVAHDSVDLSQFTLAMTKEEARNKVHLPVDKRIILYAGHLYDRKGADTLAQSSSLLPADCNTVFLGGTDTEIRRFRAAYGVDTAITIVGRVSHAQVPLYLRAADILVLPNSGVSEDAARFTSPMKLFEYMASHRPIVASDVESVREILSDHEAFLVPPDDPQALASGIMLGLSNEEIACKKADAAYASVEVFTWRHRAEKILAAMS